MAGLHGITDVFVDTRATAVRTLAAIAVCSRLRPPRLNADHPRLAAQRGAPVARTCDGFDVSRFAVLRHRALRDSCPRNVACGRTDLSCDVGWEPVQALGLFGVAQVALDADWSALRFRLREAIRSFTRRSPTGTRR